MYGATRRELSCPWSSLLNRAAVGSALALILPLLFFTACGPPTGSLQFFVPMTRNPPDIASFTNKDGIIVSISLLSNTGIALQQSNQLKVPKPLPGNSWKDLVFAKDENAIYFIENEGNMVPPFYTSVRKLCLANDVNSIDNTLIETVDTAEALRANMRFGLITDLVDVSQDGKRLLLRILGDGGAKGAPGPNGLAGADAYRVAQV
jgi:hypothetical protein